jgi:hypothetical protein
LFAPQFAGKAGLSYEPSRELWRELNLEQFDRLGYVGAAPARPGQSATSGRDQERKVSCFFF